MGIFGALTTAVTGMRAQSFALENVSGNIANSQTTAFKRMDTSFVDLIPDAQSSRQPSGTVVASSRMTNTVQGDLQASSIATHMAINGDGFFVVQKPGSFTDNRPVFDGIDLYTRRGDFQPDKNGYLVNGAGYYLMGIPVDPVTGNLVGSVPQLLQFQNDFLPAQATTQIDYRANLAAFPLTPGSSPNVPRSELLNPANFSANPISGAPSPAKITGTGALLMPDGPAVITGAQDISALNTGGGATTLVINGVNIAIPPSADAIAVRNAINAAAVPNVSASINASNQLVLTTTGAAAADTAITNGGGSTLSLLSALGIGVGTQNPTNLLTQSAVGTGQTLEMTIGANPPTVITFGNGPGEVSTMAELSTAVSSLTGAFGALDTTNGNMTITALNLDDTITIGGDATALNFGMRTVSALPSNQQVVAQDLSAFLASSVGGGAVTAFDSSGSPVNIQLRWAKIDSAEYGGTDTWNLFYQVDSGAVGTATAWQNVGVNYRFAANGQMNPPITNVTLANVVINGISLGNIQLSHGNGGVTQFADLNGNAQVNLLQQNGFPAGSLQEVSVNDKGRAVGSYSNGRTIDIAEITLANFNGSNYLKRIDGGAFEATDESGPPTYGGAGKIIGSALEGSNTDIADEFTKLIVTQQAYSANTRVISTTNQMVQDLLNMLR